MKANFLTDYFDMRNCGTDIRTEIVAGITTFLAMMYIVVLNPVILAEAGVPHSASVTATVLVTAVSSILMGIYARTPLVIAPGMSLNYMFVMMIVRSGNIKLETALGCVFYAGVIFLGIVLFDRRRLLINGIPRMLRYGVAGGIGLYIALIGMKSAGFIVGRPNGGLMLGESDPAFLTFILCFVIATVHVMRRIKGAFIWSVIISTLIAVPLGRLWGDTTVVTWQGLYQAPDFSLLFKLDLVGAAKSMHLALIIVLAFSTFFDSYSTCVGVSEAGDLVDGDGEPVAVRESLVCNAIALAISGIIGASPATAYIESSTGVRAGGRTGLTAIVAGLLFLPFLFLSPLINLVPSIATAPLLIMAGVFMLKPLIYVRWERFDEAIPFFITMITMPLTESITQGVIWGILSWTVIKIGSGKYRQVSWIVIVLDLMAIFLLLNLEVFRH
ncbi:MAG: NCS2 family permease [Candidatus Marinimicrobia bacterium]|nr:NCS2 family permease [Candidatus Neomarinimicrobiota bacterium]